MNILITGSNGQLGSELKELSLDYSYNFFFTSKDDLDICDFDDIKFFCKNNKITHIINCAGYTAVDKAEEDKNNADKVNHLATQYLAEIAKEQNIKLIHISTDYVFDGKNYKPYTEDDKTNPTSIYGQTKLDGENSMQYINPINSIIIRTSWVYSSYGSNFVKTMLNLSKKLDKLGIIYDQVGSPTYAKDLANTILDIIPNIKNDSVQIYNYSNEGVLSWYDFAKTIFEISNISIEVDSIQTKDYPTPAKRPHYSLLNKDKIKKEFNITIPYWKDSLKKCLKQLGEIDE